MKFVPKDLRETADSSRGDASLRSFLKNSLAVLITLTALYLFLGLVADLVAWTLPERYEAELLGLSPFEWADEPAEHPGFERAGKLFDELVAAAGLRPLPYRLYLLELDDPNAVAVPGGGVGLSRGLLERVESEIGLATVLGHELGHHQNRHILRQLGRSLLYRVALGLMFGNSGSSLLEGTVVLAESSFSRRQETEADEFALRLVRRHFGHTEGSLEFFEMIRDEFEDEPGTWGVFLSSHPLTQERIDHLRDLQNELE